MKIKELTIVIVTNNLNEKYKQAVESAHFAQNILTVKMDKPIQNFSAVRNTALQDVKTEWVLFLDSDEILDTSAGTEISSIITRNLYDAVTIKRIDYFYGKPLLYGETGNLSLIRMFKAKKGHFVGNVHEIVEYSGKLGAANFSISHYSHDSIKSFLEKIKEYSILAAKNKQITKTELLFQLIFFPPTKFIHNYLFKLGFLDGIRGLIYALLMSMHSFFVRVFYYEKNI